MYFRLSHSVWMVSICGEWTFSRPNRPSCTYWTMDIWTLSSMHQVSDVCFWRSWGEKAFYADPFWIFFFLDYTSSEVTFLCIFRSWLCLGIIYARTGWNPFPEGEQRYIMLLSFFISGSSQLLWFLWYSEAICISALTGYIYTLMKPFPHYELPIINLLPDSTSTTMVILKFSLLQLTR